MNTQPERPIRRSDRAADAERARQIAQQAPFAVVATADAAGRPYAVPVNAVLIGDRVCFHTTASESRRNDNMRANPHVTLTFVARSEVLPRLYSCDYASCVIEGTSSEVLDPAEKTRILEAIIARWAPENDAGRNARYIAKHLEGCAVWSVAIERIAGKERR